MFKDPCVRLQKGIYGHPESEAAWDTHLGKHLKSKGWLPVGRSPGAFMHAVSGSMPVVFVDDLLMLSSHEHTSHL